MNNNDDTIQNYGNKLEKYRAIIGDLTESASENLNPKRAKNLQKIFKDAERAYDRMKNAAAHDYEDLKQAAHDGFENLKQELSDISDNISFEALKEKGDELVDYGRDKLDDLEDRIAERPLASVLLAFGAGIILANLLRGSR